MRIAEARLGPDLHAMNHDSIPSLAARPGRCPEESGIVAAAEAPGNRQGNLGIGVGVETVDTYHGVYTGRPDDTDVVQHIGQPFFK